MRRRVSRVILKTLLIHDEVSIMLVFHKQLNLTYTHEHGKKAETSKVKKLVVCKCSSLNGTVSNLTATLFFNLDLVLFCDLIIKLKFTSTNNLFHGFSLYSKFNFREIDSDN